MPKGQFDSQEWCRRLKVVENHSRASQTGLAYLTETSLRDPNLLRIDLRHRDLLSAKEELEPTFLVRLFAEFESALRSYWPTVHVRRTPRRISILIDRVASIIHVDSYELINVHSVRKKRNLIVHESDEKVSDMSLADAHGHLCKFLSRLY